MTSEILFRISILRENEFSEIEMSEDGISFLEGENKTQIKAPSNWTG